MIVGTGFPSICSDGSTIKMLATAREMKRMDFKMIVWIAGVEIISRDPTVKDTDPFGSCPIS